MMLSRSSVVSWAVFVVIVCSVSRAGQQEWGEAMKRREVVKLFIGGAGASVLAACGVAPQAPPAAPTAPPAAAAATRTQPVATVVSATAKPAAPTARSGGTLRQAMALEVVSLDPML